MCASGCLWRGLSAKRAKCSQGLILMRSLMTCVSTDRTDHRFDPYAAKDGTPGTVFIPLPRYMNKCTFTFIYKYIYVRTCCFGLLVGLTPSSPTLTHNWLPWIVAVNPIRCSTFAFPPHKGVGNNMKTSFEQVCSWCRHCAAN